MTDHDETLRALIEKWRTQSIEFRDRCGATGIHSGHMSDALNRCADDLEAALRVPVDRPRGHEQEQADPTRVDAMGAGDDSRTAARNEAK